MHNYLYLCIQILKIMKHLAHYITILLSLLALPLHAQDYYVQCEDTCSHIHGIDLSHYQGNVFWETIGDNTHMAYVYLKATEGGDRIDATFERNIWMAHQQGLKVGSYHFYRPKTDQLKQLRNFQSQCIPEEQDLVPMIDVESTGGTSIISTCRGRLTTTRS